MSDFDTINDDDLNVLKHYRFEYKGDTDWFPCCAATAASLWADGKAVRAIRSESIIDGDEWLGFVRHITSERK